MNRSSMTTAQRILLIDAIALVVLVGPASEIYASHRTNSRDVQRVIRDYQQVSACQRADLSFNGGVNAIDLKLISDWFGRNDAPFWFDQDDDGVISILDISAVASKNGRTC